MSDFDNAFRISPQQQRLWALEESSQAGRFYIKACVKLSGLTGEEDWPAALERLVSRYEILHTAFCTPKGLRFPLQVLLEGKAITGCYQLHHSADMDFTLPVPPFALDKGHCLSVSVSPVESGCSDLVLTLPAYCADAISLKPLVQQLLLSLTGQPLEESPLQFADLAEWRNQLQEDEMDEGQHYWKTQMEGFSAEIPYPFLRASQKTDHPTLQRISMDPTLGEVISAAAEKAGVKNDEWLLACWWVLLSRQLNNAPVSMVYIPGKRSDEELDLAIGPLASLLPLAASNFDNQGIASLARMLSEKNSQHIEWQDSYACSNDSAAYDSLVACEFLTWDEDVRVGEIYATPIAYQNHSEELAAKLTVLSMGRAISLSLDFDACYCHPVAMQRLAEQFDCLLRSAAKMPDMPVTQLNMLTQKQREQLLQLGCGTSVSREPNARVTDLIALQVEKTPDAVALRCADGMLSYAEMWQRVTAFAADLNAAGVGTGDRVGLLLRRSPEMIISMLGAMQADAVYVPLEPDQPFSRIQTIVNSVTPNLVFTHDDLLSEFQELNCLVTSELSNSPSHEMSNGRNQAAYILYTSGSTGQPKGVVLGHASLYNHMAWMINRYPLMQDDCVLFKTPFSFDASVWEYLLPLMQGGQIYVAKPGGHQDVAYLSRVINEQGITILQGVPTLLRALLEQEEFASTNTLRRVFSGGEVLHSHLADVFSKRCQAEIINLYGPTEATIQVTHHCYQSPFSGNIPVGRPIDNVHLYVLDEHQQLQPFGVEGELYIGGAAPALGYYEQPKLTEAVFVADLFSSNDSERMYRSGDMVAWNEEGELLFRGRRDNQVKFHGYRMELSEIENIAADHPMVEQACVVNHHNTESGFDELLCYVVPKLSVPTQAWDDSLLRGLLAERLPAYMVPSRYYCLPSMPLTHSGKIDRTALPDPAQLSQNQAHGGDTPADQFELRLLDIWQRVLGVNVMGVHDDFFSLGGHSLLAVKLMAEVEAEFGQHFPLSVLFEASSVSAMSVIIRQQCEYHVNRSLVPIRKGGSDRPLFFVHPTGGNVLCYFEMAQTLAPEQPFYGLQDPGLFNSEIPYSTLPELAALYVEEIRSVQSHGPYFLGGWSSGGVIAYEIAQQLLALGEEVAMLALVDSHAPQPGDNTPRSEQSMFNSVVGLLAYQSGTDMVDIEVPDDEQARYVLLLELAQKARLLGENSQPQHVQRMYQVFRKNVEIVTAYEAKPYPRRIQLFRASEPLPDKLRSSAIHRSMNDDPTLAWGRLATVTVHHVPGHHLNMIAAPQLDTFSNSLNTVIEDTNRIYNLGDSVLFWMLGN